MTAEWSCEEYLDEAYKWQWYRRRKYLADADIWWLRQRWQHEKTTILRELALGRYRFEPLRQIALKSGETIELWPARDALVLKLLPWKLAGLLPASSGCTQ